MARNRPAAMYDISLILQAGINPENGLPLKYNSGSSKELKNKIRDALNIIDRQTAVNRYVWGNLPCNLSSQDIERLLYYKGQLCFFYFKELDQFFFMPYTLSGTIDFYGRFNTIHPVPMVDGKEEKSEGIYKSQLAILSDKILEVAYGIVPEELLTEEMLYNTAVILKDYTRPIGEQIVPRFIINAPIIDVESECVPYMRTSLISGCGVKGVRVNNADEAENVEEGAKGLYNAAIGGEPWIPIEGAVDFQELADGQTIKSEEFMISMQSIDNLRLQTYGLQNGGLFEKKAHMLESENEINQNNVELVYQDGLSLRQEFCNIVNSIWGLGIYCLPSENVLGADINGDGVLYDDNNDGESTGEDTNGTSENA